MYTLQHEQAEDDHYQDFLKTFEFISGGGENHEALRHVLHEYRQEPREVAQLVAHREILPRRRCDARGRSLAREREPPTPRSLPS